MIRNYMGFGYSLKEPRWPGYSFKIIEFQWTEWLPRLFTVHQCRVSGWRETPVYSMRGTSIVREPMLDST